MNTSLEASPDNPRDKPRKNTVAFFITDSLGYCCEWFFFSRYADAELIAFRLGVTINTIRRHKRWVNEGRLCCNKTPCCMADKKGTK